MFEKIWAEATEAGRKAVAACTPRPMVVSEVGLDDKPYPGSKSYFVEDGVCGFAWVMVRPATTAFAKWLKTLPRTGEYLEPRYDGCLKGISIWIIVGNQSMQKKEAYAEAMAKVLEAHGFRASAGSRLD
jgi:hypothetical protein